MAAFNTCEQAPNCECSSRRKKLPADAGGETVVRKRARLIASSFTSPRHFAACDWRRGIVEHAQRPGESHTAAEGESIPRMDSESESIRFGQGGYNRGLLTCAWRNGALRYDVLP